MLNKLCAIRSKMAYPLRRIVNSDIKSNHIVIDLGCGGLPNPRANIAVDFFDDDLERSEKLNIDRPFVWASIDKLPFKDKCIDYSILSHVLEHLEQPKLALDEIQRISGAGYIETPNAFFEYAIPHTYHVSRVTVMDETLHINMKKKWDDTSPYYDVVNDLKKAFFIINKLDVLSNLTIYKWKSKINYIVNGEASCTKAIELMNTTTDKRSAINKFLIKAIYLIFKIRLKIINIQDYLCCPKCHGTLVFENEKATCKDCSNIYNKHKGHYDFRISEGEK